MLDVEHNEQQQATQTNQVRHLRDSLEVFKKKSVVTLLRIVMIIVMMTLLTALRATLTEKKASTTCLKMMIMLIRNISRKFSHKSWCFLRPAAVSRFYFLLIHLKRASACI